MDTQQAMSHGADSELERQLLAALHPPHDVPLIEHALRAARDAIRRYARSLGSPAVALVALEADLDVRVRPGSEPAIPTRPLYRRLARHPAYALLLDLAANPDSPDWIWIATGATLAEALLVRGRQVPPSVARRLRVALERGAATATAAESATRRVIDALHRSVDTLLDATTVTGDAVPGLGLVIAAHYRKLLHFTGERRRQGVQDRASLSSASFVAASRTLRERVESGDAVARLIAVCAITGLPPALAHRLPLLDTVIDDWVAALDVGRGLYLMDLDLIAPHAARPRPGVKGLVAATRILVRPMPAFLVTALEACRVRYPDATTLGGLVPGTCADGRTLAGHGDEDTRGFRPSLARYLTTIETEMLRIGIDRLSAAHLSGRYQGIAHASLYYGLVHRDELWAAASRWFAHLGWGAPAPLAEGLPTGARATPTAAGLSAWYTAMATQVCALAPGRRYRLESLLAHHGAYSRLVAALVGFLLAGRNRDPIPLDADSMPGTLPWIRFGDKAVSLAHQPGPQAVCPSLSRQLALWQRHCAALAARLRRCAPTSADAITHLEGIAHGAPVAALVELVPGRSGLRVRALGGADLLASWPTDAKFAGNFGRAFWHQALRRHGVPSRDIDAFVRHQVPGRRPYSSTDDRIPADLIARIVRVQEQVLAECGIRPVQGLAR